MINTPDKKETSLGMAIFIYFIALVVICIIAYNLYFSLVFINYDMTDALMPPDEGASLPEIIWYKYASLFIPLAGNTQACSVIAVAVPVLVLLLIAASFCLAKHFAPDRPAEDTAQQTEISYQPTEDNNDEA